MIKTIREKNQPDMDKIKNEVRCALCKILLQTVEYNLNIHNSKYSDTPLILILESIAGKFPIIHFDICMHCYNLLNELDAIVLRQTEIQNQFKKYLEHLQQPISTATSDDHPQNILNEIKDINLLQSEETVEDNLTDGFLIESTDIKCINSKESDINLEGSKNATEEGESYLSEISTSKSGKRKKHSTVLKSHKCHCLKVFRTAGELKNHMNSHNKHRAFVCEICGQSYKHKTAFNIHMDMHKGINPFVCVYCKKSFTQKGALVRHVPIHTREMPYQCDECGKRFVHHTSFNVHRLSHRGLKSYKCDLCGLGLTSGSHLKRHKRIHTGEKKFICSTCGKRFAERYNLGVHEKLHTNPCSNALQKRNYSCQICGVSFERKVKLDEHLVKEHQIIRSDLDDKQAFLKQSVTVDNNSCPAIISNG